MDVFPNSRLEQRKNFYTQEFSPEFLDYFFKIKPQFYAIDHGSESRISNSPLKSSIELLPPNMSSIHLKSRLSHELPERVFYDRNLYKDPNKCISCMQFSKCFSCPINNHLGQELVFTFKAKNIKCTSCKHGQVCPNCVQLSQNHAFALRDELLKSFDDVKVVNIGDGAQVHVHDKFATNLTLDERKRLVSVLHHFPFEKEISPENRLAVLPFSLNGVSSRKVVPVHDFFEDAVSSERVLPSFLKKTPVIHHVDDY